MFMRVASVPRTHRVYFYVSDITIVPQEWSEQKATKTHTKDWKSKLEKAPRRRFTGLILEYRVNPFETSVEGVFSDYIKKCRMSNLA